MGVHTFSQVYMTRGMFSTHTTEKKYPNKHDGSTFNTERNWGTRSSAQLSSEHITEAHRTHDWGIFSREYMNT